jgi:hypothetical protein
LYTEPAEKILVFKIVVHPIHSTELGFPVAVLWRFVTVFCDTTLDSFHDQILTPAMG